MMSVQTIKGGSFLFEDRKANEIFTREDISEEQQMFARVTEEFMTKEVLPRAEQIYSKDWALTREGRTYGHYTTRVVIASLPQEEQAQYAVMLATFAQGVP